MHGNRLQEETLSTGESEFLRYIGIEKNWKASSIIKFKTIEE